MKVFLATLANSSGTNAAIAAGVLTLTTGTGADLSITGKAGLVDRASAGVHIVNATAQHDFIHLIRIRTDSEINAAVKLERLA